MASMSRARTQNPALIPTPLQAEYYRQHASAGLILTEGTWPSCEAIGASNVPGLFAEEQAEGWKGVTDAAMRQAAVSSCNSVAAARCPIPTCSAGLCRWRHPLYV